MKTGSHQIQIDQDNREIKEHGSFPFPVMVSYEMLSSYERSSFFWHWHPEIELTLILEGDISYQVSEQIFHLKAGDGIFCNSNMPHTGKRKNSEDCIYISITLDPKIIYGFESSLLQTKYVSPLILNSQLASIVFHPDVFWQKKILEHLQSIWELKQNQDDSYEFRVQILLARIWLLLYEHVTPQTIPFSSVSRDRERILAILSYLHNHYTEKITLEEVAAQINICSSECCRFFKKNMKESIFDYLIHYRIEKSLSLLENSTESITEISLKAGFSNSCYFSKVFREEIGCSPSEYRKQMLGRLE